MTRNVLILILIINISSSFAQENFKEYYYQIGTKKEIKIYEYVDKNNPKRIEYWKVTTNPKTKIILTESFTTDFRLYNIFEEELKVDGAKIISYTDFEKIDSGENIRINGIIIDKDVYKWNDKNKYKYSVKYKSLKYGNEQFIKERTKNSFENIDVKGTNYSTLKFMDEYEIKSLDSDQSYEFYQFTYYAKDIGMVKYQRYHPDGTTVELELTKILTENEFKNLIKKASR
ncbi:hypothetical protein [Algibacter sp. L1A34]|uniref:hypothetical protein n=1 Tax=Algibacter sp. L1A34 TaxID=2686365 RepID=UPI00131DAEA0|nr:hypothetical protein [Algibacter sp. L1A34]